MSGVIGATLAVALAWVATYCLLSGWSSFWPVHRGQSPLTGRRFWIGLALCIAFLQAWHLLLPVDWRAALATVTLGAAGWALHHARNTQPRTISGRAAQTLTAVQRKIFIALSAVIVLWTANRCLPRPEFYDAGLYYFQSIRWLNEYPMIPGLGNLHGRLAFNQSYFLLPAVLNVAPYFNKGYHLANGFLLAVLAVQLLYRAMTPAVLTVRLFSTFMLIVVLKQIERESLSSPMPDTAVFALGVLLILWFAEFLCDPRESGESVPESAMSMAALAALGITFKLSFLGFAAATVLLVLVLSLPNARNPLTTKFARLIPGLVLLSSLGGVWVLRGIVTSGYPLYPATVAGLSVDWKIPEQKVARMRTLISSWARTPGQKPAAADEHWLKPWLARTLKNSQVNRPLALFTFACIALTALRFRPGIAFPRDLWLPLLPPVAWLLFWFFTAPDPRFARAPLWLLAVWPVAFLIAAIVQTRRWPEQSVLYAVLLFGFLLVVPRAVEKGSFARDLTSCGFGVLPAPALKEAQTASGLRVLVPVADDRAWNAPLPSTPVLDPALQLRGKTMADGFRVNPAAKPTNQWMSLHEIRIHLPSNSLHSLKENMRQYAMAHVTIGSITYSNAAVRLKGMGAFLPLDQKPGFAVKFNEFQRGRKFIGCSKILLNNCLHDPGFVSETFANRLFRDAGLPAPRATFAKVIFNGRDLGLYTLIEAVNEPFLKREFGNGNGNLYEGVVQDIDAGLDQDNGQPGDQLELKGLAAAARLTNVVERYSELEKRLDMKLFARFAAMEMLVNHWDGYAMQRSNYRIYQNPLSGKLVFIPHGMDSTFRHPNAPVWPPHATLLVDALIQTPEGRQMYANELTTLATSLFQTNRVLTKLDALANVLRPELKSRGANALTEWEHALAAYRTRVLQRIQNISTQLPQRSVQSP